MDFTFDNTPLLNHDEKTNSINNNRHGSGFTKQERSEPNHPPDDQQPFLPSSKSSRIDYFHQPIKSMPTRSIANNMLSFSSSTKDENNQTSSLFSFYQPSPAYIRNTGYGSGGLQASMHMPVSRYKGPFTPSQWMELEHQALIYKHFVANVPVPSHLLNPLRKSLDAFLFPGSSSLGAYAPHSYGWGSFHLGLSGNPDPEPGRCRRTDGKKWRCSRDAVPDQKYCERHINRGRHRSRKPVEGQNGHTVSSSKVGPVSSIPISTTRSSTRASVPNPVKILDPQNAVITPSVEAQAPISRAQESQVFDIKSFSVPKQHNPIKEPEGSLMYPTNYGSFLDQSASDPNPLPNFGDEWSKEIKTDWTQLSMSIPMASADFSSSSNSPAQEKLSIAPISLSQEFDLDPTHKHASNWIPISWENSLGGPLGEVLNRTSSSNGEKSKNGSSMAEMWDGVSYNMGSSPTGVLQKTTFVSLSNSSSGSSPKGNKMEDHGGGIGGSLCDELLLSTLTT